MPRNYQCKRGNPYLLPHDIYMRVLYTIKGYDRMRDEYQDAEELRPPALTGMPGNSEPSNPTERGAVRRAMIFYELHAIEQALRAIPSEYRQGVKRNVLYGEWYPRDASDRTYRRWKQRFIHCVAEKLNLV